MEVFGPHGIEFLKFGLTLNFVRRKMTEIIYLKAPECTTPDNRHTLTEAEGPFFAECADCEVKFYLIAEPILVQMGIQMTVRPLHRYDA